MALGPIETNGMLSRVQDVSIIKHNEDNKTFMDQSNFQNQFKKEVKHNLSQVKDANNSENSKQNFDAREESKNKYYKQNNKKNQDKKEDISKVIYKNTSSFDVKI